MAGALACGAGSFACCGVVVWQAVVARARAVTSIVSRLSFLIPIFIYDLHYLPLLAFEECVPATQFMNRISFNLKGQCVTWVRPVT